MNRFARDGHEPRLHLAREGRPIAAGMFKAIFDGVTELIGIATCRIPAQGFAAYLTAAMAQSAFAYGPPLVFLCAVSGRPAMSTARWLWPLQIAPSIYASVRHAVTLYPPAKKGRASRAGDMAHPQMAFYNHMHVEMTVSASRYTDQVPCSTAMRGERRTTTMNETQAQLQAGYADFDFLIGPWKIRHHQLREILKGSTSWDEFKRLAP